MQSFNPNQTQQTLYTLANNLNSTRNKMRMDHVSRKIYDLQYTVSLSQSYHNTHGGPCDCLNHA